MVQVVNASFVLLQVLVTYQPLRCKVSFC